MPLTLEQRVSRNAATGVQFGRNRIGPRHHSSKAIYSAKSRRDFNNKDLKNQWVANQVVPVPVLPSTSG